ncbi:ADP-ribosylglycohydrolase family protein [Paramaledivibacter caminithermalis]|jgi:ADP-ribosylglycohydrolase|uniref:ADP-ribosylglycohydrolase n=1 Tax=Paramaledivibacter caminithermalis (strain DSM 15212 / CIP 107654 / DViRD3) TaxID=1121301 RepID=A0A1M6RXG3_PARC5|nr:ADP-ribosylglycohydrolase family protein [Paramaledivibacter caminithermalis]SHK37131.1 ADP-ribosylglycohydrolase [Paramaledivibacter caminithermalis DSM 15212]
MGNISFEERVKGVVIATAYGDALGATIEKLSYDEIKAKYGRVEGLNTKWWKADWPPEERLNKIRGNGIITDDTLMTLALMNVYNNLQRHIDSYDMADEFVKEIAFRKRYIPEFDKEALIMDRLFYPEKYIFMRHTLANCNPREGGIGNMVNCGAAMYISPIGIVNACNPKGAYDEAILFAIGHQWSYGLEAAGVLAACVAKAFVPDVTIDEVVETALCFAKDGTRMAIKDIYEVANKLKKHKDNKELIVREFHKAIKKYSPMGDDVSRSIEKVGIPSNHYTPSRLFSIEELPIALGYCVIHEGDFYETIIDGVNSGRDTDSIGVMIGAILGAMYGSSILDKNDISILEEANKSNLIENADKFAKTAINIIKKDMNLRKEMEKHINSMI